MDHMEEAAARVKQKSDRQSETLWGWQSKERGPSGCWFDNECKSSSCKEFEMPNFFLYSLVRLIIS